ncbi:MAG: hypothetical protein IKY04_05650 [Lachnospiraceae bacterium]|nr:hypothetical protein [Lachnospiraceae bacterium]MBR4993717.1 hypothetical protein [Lachnospiraceae bacterium]MBR5945099.1 hypothetical protein [Lachnospiraceae bacterium]
MSEQLSKEEFVAKYKGIIEPMMRYMPWLLNASGKAADAMYGNDGIANNSLAFPVFDSNLMSFVKEMGNTPLMNRNYPYVYSKKGMKNAADELRAISEATINDIDVLNGILSKYVMGGRTKAALWNAGVKDGIFLKLLEKYKELLEYWDGTTIRDY